MFKICSIFAALVLLMPNSPAQEIHQAFGQPATPAFQQKANATPLPRITNKNFLPEITLPALSDTLKQAQQSDDSTMQTKGPEQIGLWQDFDTPVLLNEFDSTHGDWEYAPDFSKVWALKIQAKGAIGIRLQLLDIHFPAQAEISLYDAATGKEYYGPFTQKDFADSTFWLPTCFSDSVILECFVPAASYKEPLSLRIERIANIYKEPVLSTIKALPGACNNDVTCFPAWTNAARGVCGLSTVSLGAVLFCTGSLLTDTDPCTDIPYLLTAHHCVQGSTGGTGSDSLECYWLYQTSSCNGVPPTLASVPRTIGGADYLAGAGGRGDTGGGNDFTFVRLRNQPPATVFYNGWTTAPVPTSTAVTVIHHPRGDYKRISFGNTLLNINFNPQDYHACRWSSGTTEPGSSGSPLFLDSSHQIIGQLWGGNASCTNTTGADLYGRFDVTFPLIQSYISAGPALLSLPAAQTVTEGDTLTVTVSLPWTSNGSGSQFDYTLIPGTATPGQDYTFDSGMRRFNTGESTQSIAIQTLDNDTTSEAAETFTLIIENPLCSTINPAKNTCTITILDNDSGSIPSITVPFFKD